MLSLEGKTALITGASSGLGVQFARTLRAAGARVILASRSMDKLEALSDELGNARAIQMDVSDKTSVASCFAELEKAGERIDICVGNAGVGILTPIFEVDDNNDFESIIQTNLMGVWYVTKHVANHMKYYDILNISSINGEAIPVREGAAYSMSKAAVIHLTKTLVEELSPHKIRINCISPGWFTTLMNAGSEIEKIIPRIPCDLDGLILYLASNAASRYVTGATFTIDGGASWGGAS